LRAIPGTPIVHINRSVMILEPPSDATLKVKEMVCFFFTPAEQCFEHLNRMSIKSFMRLP
jgi:hypothetical protein